MPLEQAVARALADLVLLRLHERAQLGRCVVHVAAAILREIILAVAHEAVDPRRARLDADVVAAARVGRRSWALCVELWLRPQQNARIRWIVAHVLLVKRVAARDPMQTRICTVVDFLPHGFVEDLDRRLPRLAFQSAAVLRPKLSEALGLDLAADGPAC